MESFTTLYPVVFFDGESEHDKGQVGIHPSLTFKKFKGLIAQKIGLPANKLSAIFICHRASKGSDKKQRLPINENTNFSRILNQHNPNREKDCYFLISIKKLKRDRKGPRKRGAEAEFSYVYNSVQPELLGMGPEEAYFVDGNIPYGGPLISPMGGGEMEEHRNFMLNPLGVTESSDLGRAYPRQGGGNPFFLPRDGGGGMWRPQHPPGHFSRPPFVGMENSVVPHTQDMHQWMPPHYLMGGGGGQGELPNACFAFQNKRSRDDFSGEIFQNKAFAAAPFPSSMPSIRNSSRKTALEVVVSKSCDICHDYSKRENVTPPFHWCVRDPIITSVSGPSPAGPIERPMKRHVEAVA